MPHCEGSKDQCIKYQFFRPLHIFSVFQCCKHLDILATFVPVWASMSCVCIILWVGEIAQTNGFNSARILFYPIPQKSPFWILESYFMCEKRNLDFTNDSTWMATSDRDAVEGPAINMHSGVQALCMWLEGGYGLPREERFRFIILRVGSGFM